MYTYRCEVLRVIDGDSLECQLHLGFEITYTCVVRLSGVDAWESRTRDVEEKKKGIAATSFTSQFVTGGKEIIFMSKSYDAERGKYGRVIGMLEVDGELLNSALIEAGHAKTYSKKG